MSGRIAIMSPPCQWRYLGLWCLHCLVERIHDADGVVLPGVEADYGTPPTIADILHRIAETCAVAEAPPCGLGSGLCCHYAPAAPTYDTVCRILWVGGLPVRHFRRRAENQEAILQAFQDQGWPPQIDDPSRTPEDLDPVHRLNDAIYELNARQKKPQRIRFHGDGTRRGIRWEFIE